MSTSGIKNTSTLRHNSSIFYNEKFFYLITAVALTAYCIVFILIKQNGYGDNANNYGMLRSWQEMVANGIYVPSRAQGNIPSEIILGSLAAILGPTGANGFSFVLSIVALSLLFYFFTEICTDKVKIALAIMTIAFNPFWMNASSTSMDYIHPIAFFLVGVLCFEKNLPLASDIFGNSERMPHKLRPFGLRGFGPLHCFQPRKRGSSNRVAGRLCVSSRIEPHLFTGLHIITLELELSHLC